MRHESPLLRFRARDPMHEAWHENELFQPKSQADDLIERQLDLFILQT